jgi:hypothetical protein
MTIDEARRIGADKANIYWPALRTALVAALAEVDRLTGELEHAEKYRPDRDYHCDRAKALAAEVDRLRSLPVIPTCGDCCNSGIDDRTEDEVCKHGLASDDVDFYPAVAMTAPPPEWCPLKARR